MKRTATLLETLKPWAGLAVGLLAAGIVHQLGSEGTFDKCAAMVPGPLLAIAAVGLLACAVAGLVSWQSMRGDERSAHRVIAIISVGSAALFCLAILLPMVAALVLPPCYQ